MTPEVGSSLIYRPAQLRSAPESAAQISTTDEEWSRSVIADRYGSVRADAQILKSRPWSTIVRWTIEREPALILKVPASPFKYEADVLGFVDTVLDVPQVIAKRASGAFLMPMLRGTSLRGYVRDTKDFASLIPPIESLSSAQRELARRAPPAALPIMSRETLRHLAVEHLRLSGDGSKVSRDRLWAGFDFLFDVFGESVDHGDFQDNNVLLVERMYTVLDWGDAYWTCPIFSLATYVHAVRLAHPQIPYRWLNEIVRLYFRRWDVSNTDARLVLSACHRVYPIVAILRASKLLTDCGPDAKAYGHALQSYWRSTLSEM